MTTTRAIGYVRVSTEEQSTHGVSLAAQEVKLRAYCDLYEIDLIAIEVDAGVSAKSLARPALQRALAALKRGDASAIVICKLDRLTRSLRDLAELLDMFRDGKRALLSVGEQIDTRSASGRLVLNLLTSVAEWEREAIGERTSAAKQYLQSQGRYIGGIAPYGYQVSADGESLVEVPDEQSVIRVARELRAITGMSLRAVAATLAERGVLARSGRPFAASAIAAMTAA